MQSEVQTSTATDYPQHYNQLFFNLNKPRNTENVGIRFNKPAPIIIEKLTGNKKEPQKCDRPKPFKFSAVSEEKLKFAVELAKHDVKQMMFERNNSIESEEVYSTRKPVQDKKKAVIKTKVLSRHIDDKDESKNNYRQNAEVIVKPSSISTTSKPKGFIVEPSRKVKMLEKEATQRTGRSKKIITPRSGTSSTLKDQDSKQAQEIKRLRKELGNYIQKIETLSKAGPSPDRGTSLVNHKELDEVEERRKQVRAVEQASRSARLLYALQQQVREIKDDLDRIGPSQIRHTRKSRALNRLAAAHRGAVRALQSFIQQLPGKGETTTTSQPPMYQELGLLIQQLSLCCSQMEIDGNGVPDDILDILQEAAAFQSNANEKKPKMSTSATTCRQPEHRGKGSQMHKKEMTSKKEVTSYPKKEIPVRDTDLVRTSVNETEDGPIVGNTKVFEEEEADMEPEEEDDMEPREEDFIGPREKAMLHEHEDVQMISDRDYALRARLEALIKAKDVQKQVTSNRPKKDVQRQATHRSAQVRNIYRPRSAPSPRYHKTTKKTSVLLPPKYKRMRKKNIEPQKESSDIHFTNATIASKLKVREAVKPPNNPLPPWSPGGVPRRVESDFTNEGSVLSDMRSPLSSPRMSPGVSPRHNPRLSPRQSPRPSPRVGSARRKVHFEEDSEMTKLMSQFVEKEVARQAWLDKQSYKKVSEMQASRSQEIDRLTAEVIEQAEEAVRMKVQPLLESKQHHRTFEEKLHVGGREGEEFVDETEKLKRTDDDILMEERALDMKDEPALEKLIQRLEEMETEEDIIRRRLQKISYSDCDGGIVKHRQVNYEEDAYLTLKGTPLEGAQLEKMSADAPMEHTSLKFTKKITDTKAYKPQVHYRLPKNSSQDADFTESDEEKNILKTGQKTVLEDYYHNTSKTREKDSKQLIPHMNIYLNVEERTGTTRLGDLAPLTMPSTTLTIPIESRREIEACRGRFEQHLKKTSHHTYGAFNPWKLVEEVSDEILNEVLESVSDEIGNMTELFVENVYKQEFSGASSKPIS